MLTYVEYLTSINLPMGQPRKPEFSVALKFSKQYVGSSMPNLGRCSR